MRARDDAMAHSIVGLHVVLAVDDGQFVSSIDPPADARSAVDACTNDGLFPVLLGDEGSADVVLASPIILYDHPAVAPESQGDMFDATEIDEILALRVLTLTDEEKAEARQTDPRGGGDHRPLRRDAPGAVVATAWRDPHAAAGGGINAG